MTNPPPLPPPQLNYSPPPPNRRKTVAKVILRIIAGAGVGVGCCIAGFYLAALTRVPLLIFVPFGVVLAVAVYIAIRYRRFGYVTGLFLAPFILAAGLVLLMFIICGIVGLKH